MRNHDHWLVEEKGYKCLDIIRPKIWGKKKIPFWYKQNIVLFIKKEFVGEISSDHLSFNSADIIHPELFLQKIKNKSLIHRYFNYLKIFFKKFF